MLNEVYKVIPTNINYEVSNLGNVRNSSGCILKTYKINSGYSCLKLTTNKVRTSHLVHRLVMLAFEGESELEVNHKDGDKQNNAHSNLEYVTSSENKLHALSTGITVYNKPTLGQKLKARSSTSILSKYYGVGWDKSRSKWYAHVVYNRKVYLHKRFISELDAAQHRDACVLANTLPLPLNF